MKKTIVAALCLSLCVMTASCTSDRSNVPSAETEDNTANGITSTAATQAETSAEQSNTELSVRNDEQKMETAPQTSASAALQISDLPTEFVFSSGAGGWDTTLTLHEDGTFDGIYHDSDYLELYYSTFNGKFGQPQKTGDHTYRVKIEVFRVTNDQDKVFYDETVQYIPAEPYGLENTSGELILYTPGTPFSVMPEDCRSWLLFLENDTLAEGEYVLYNAQEGYAFFGAH